MTQRIVVPKGQDEIIEIEVNGTLFQVSVLQSLGDADVNYPGRVEIKIPHPKDVIVSGYDPLSALKGNIIEFDIP